MRTNRTRSLWLPSTLLAAGGSALLTGAALGAGRPPPPADWSSAVAHPRMVPGARVVYEYRASSADAFDLTVSVTKLPAALRLVRVGSTPYRLVDGRPTWTLRFPGGPATRSVRIRLEVKASTRIGARLCFTLRQVATNGGVPDVVPLAVCDDVRRR